MSRILVDTNVFLYALGREHPYRSACRTVIEHLRDGRIAGEASVELIQEFVQVRRRRESDATARARDVIGLCAELHAFEPADLATALDLIDAHAGLTTRDAVHAATALNREIGAILSADGHFDRVPGLERIDPLDERAVADSLIH